MAYEASRSTSEEKKIQDQINTANNANNIRKRYICSALVNGVEPSFRDFKNQPVKVDVDMEDIKAKLATGEYSTEYVKRRTGDSVFHKNASIFSISFFLPASVPQTKQPLPGTVTIHPSASSCR